MDPDLLTFLIISLNTAIMWLKSKPHIKKNPTLQKGYDIIIRGFFLWGSLPIVIIGIALRIGGVSQMKNNYPNIGNMFVALSYSMYQVGLLLLLNYWIWFRGGAKMLVEHPGILRQDYQNPQTVKWNSLFLLFVIVVITIAMFSAKPR